MKIVIDLPDDGDLSVGAYIDGVERPTRAQALALRDLAVFGGTLRGALQSSVDGRSRCSLCGRDRTPDDCYDYNPLQVMTGKPLGWYSGDDGEVCPECMTTRVMKR